LTPDAGPPSRWRLVVAPRLAVGAGLVLGCGHRGPVAVSVAPIAVGATPVPPSAPASTRSPAAPAPRSTPPRAPLVIEPAVVLPPTDGAVHASRFRWAADGSSLRYCEGSGAGSEPTRCFAVDRAGRATAIAPVEAAAPPPPSAAPAGPEPSWSLTWRVHAGADALSGPPHRGATFVLEVRRRGRDSPAVLETVAVAPGDLDATVHPDAILPSPDGATVAAVLHVRSGEGDERTLVRLWSVDELAARVERVSAVGDCPAVVPWDEGAQAAWARWFPLGQGGVGLVTAADVSLVETTSRLGLLGVRSVACGDRRAWWVPGVDRQREAELVDLLAPPGAVVERWWAPPQRAGGASAPVE
jgi:hypothetical protein